MDTNNVDERPGEGTGNDGRVLMGTRTWGGDENAALWLHCHLPSSIMGAYVAVLANPGTTQGNSNGITHGPLIGDDPCARSPRGGATLVIKIPF